jgi:hypothetical protein
MHLEDNGANGALRGLFTTRAGQERQGHWKRCLKQSRHAGAHRIPAMQNPQVSYAVLRPTDNLSAWASESEKVSGSGSVSESGTASE